MILLYYLVAQPETGHGSQRSAKFRILKGDSEQAGAFIAVAGLNGSNAPVPQIETTSLADLYAAW